MPKPFSLIYSIKCHIIFLVVKFSVFHSVYTKLARTQVNNGGVCVCVCVCVCIFQPECIYYTAIYCHLLNFWNKFAYNNDWKMCSQMWPYMIINHFQDKDYS